MLLLKLVPCKYHRAVCAAQYTEYTVLHNTNSGKKSDVQ